MTHRNPTGGAAECCGGRALGGDTHGSGCALAKVGSPFINGVGTTLSRKR